MKAHRIVNYFESNLKSNPVIPVIALTYTTFSKLLMLHGTQDKSDQGLAKGLKINPYFVKEYKIGAGNYPVLKVIENIKFIHEADLQNQRHGQTGDWRWADFERSDFSFNALNLINKIFTVETYVYCKKVVFQNIHKLH